MAAKVAAVGGIGIGFCHITKSIWVREECNTCFYAKKDKESINGLQNLMK